MDFRNNNVLSVEAGRMNSRRRLLNAQFSVLRFFGLWTPHPDSTRIFKLFYALYKKFMIAILAIQLVTITADLFANYRDLEIFTNNGCFIAGPIVIMFKLVNFQLRRERIENLVGAIHDPVDTLRCSSERAVTGLLKSFVFYEKARVYFFTGVACFLIVALMFFIPTEEGSLPIRAKYPFDTTKPPMHDIAFFIQAFAVTTTLMIVVAMDSTVINFCRFVDFQLRVLNANYANCRISSYERARLDAPRNDSAGSRSSSKADFTIRSFVPFDAKEVDVPDDNFVKRFVTCIGHHQRLIKIVDEINDLFASSMFVQLCASSAIICLTGFQAVLGGKDSGNLLKFALYLNAALSQLLCWCWFGNKLIHQSNTLATSQWFSGWEEEEDLSLVAVPMIITLIRTRRSMELKAGSFFTMSMETFITILRVSYSFFALLNASSE